MDRSEGVDFSEQKKHGPGGRLEKEISYLRTLQNPYNDRYSHEDFILVPTSFCPNVQDWSETEINLCRHTLK